MIYYNYAPYYHSPLNHYQNKQYPNLAYGKNFSKPPVSNPHPSKPVKNIQNQKIQNTNNINMNNSKTKPQEEGFRKANQTIDEALFEILGIKLYFDDILLICLIFFLYNEGVQDQYLFIALILLLLS